MTREPDLFDAVDADDADAVQRILQGAPDPNVRTTGSARYTPLHVAAHEHARAAVEALLEAGADVDAEDAHGGTPLHYATYPAPDAERDPGVVAALLAAGADPAGAAGHHPQHFEGQSVVAPYDGHGVLLAARPDGTLAAFRRPWRETYDPTDPDDWEHVFVELPSELLLPVSLAWLIARVPVGSDGQPVQISALKLTERIEPPTRTADGTYGDVEWDALGPAERLPLDHVPTAVYAGRIADPKTTTLLFAIYHEARHGLPHP